MTQPVGVAAGEGAVLTALYLSMMALFAWLFFRSAHFTWKNTIGAVLTGLGNVLNYDKWVVHIHWGDYFLHLDTRIDNFLVTQALDREEDIGRFFHDAARLQLWIVDEIWKGTRDFFLQQAWLVDHLLPLYVKAFNWTLHAIEKRLGIRVGHVETQAQTTTRTVTIPHAGELDWIHRHWKALTRAVAAGGAATLFPPLAIPKIWHGIDDLRKWRVHINKRLLRLEALFGVAAMAVAMSNVLGVPWRCLRPRGPIGRLAKALCGLETAFLAALLATAFEAFAILDLCGLVSAEEKLAAWFRPLLMELVDVDEWLIKNCGYSAPAPLTLPTLKLPKGRYGLTLNEELDYKLGLAG